MKDPLSTRASRWSNPPRILAGPAWRRIDRYGRPPRAGGLHRNSIAEIIKRRATAAGLEDAALWGGHSLRRGFATEAVAAGVSERDVQHHGRWLSPASMDPYVDAARTFDAGNPDPLARLNGEHMSVDSEPSDFDDLDRGILHALQVDARAPFRRIGEVLGVSDQTIARRYARLRDRRALRVLGMSDPVLVDERQWLFHLRVAPDGGEEIADGLAARPDTSWVARCAGGASIVGTVYGEGAEPLLLDTLPRTRRVLDVQADQVLRIFYGGAGEPYSKLGPLGEDQVQALARHVPESITDPTAEPATERIAASSSVRTGSGVALDSVDRRLLAVLRGDGRATIEQLVKATGSSTSTVRRRLQHLRSSGVLRFDVDVNPALQELTVRTLVFARIAPADLGRAGELVAEHQEVGFAAATTGSTNLFLSVSTAGLPVLYDYLTRRLGELPGLQSHSTIPVLRTVKAATTRYSARRPGAGDRSA